MTFQKKSFAAASYSASFCSNLAINVPPTTLGPFRKNLVLILAVLAFIDRYGLLENTQRSLGNGQARRSSVGRGAAVNFRLELGRHRVRAGTSRPADGLAGMRRRTPGAFFFTVSGISEPSTPLLDLGGSDRMLTRPILEEKPQY